jgi:hypothetical protein
MKNQIEIVKDIADGMYGIGGIPNNEEFYVEFDMRVKAGLGIADVGRSEHFPDYEEEIKCPHHTPYWGVYSTCGQY